MLLQDCLNQSFCAFIFLQGPPGDQRGLHGRGVKTLDAVATWGRVRQKDQGGSAPPHLGRPMRLIAAAHLVPCAPRALVSGDPCISSPLVQGTRMPERMCVRRGVRHSRGQPGAGAPRSREAPADATTSSPSPRRWPHPLRAKVCDFCVRDTLLTAWFTTMPLYEGLGSGGEKTAVVIDLGEAFTK